MANRTMNAKIINLTKTTTEWASAIDVITKGVFCVEFTDDNKVKLKVGDGAKAFADLPYASEVDLSDYFTKTEINELLAKKVDVEDGKGLSSNDFTNALKTKLENLTIDDSLSDSSENPVQNKVIKAELDKKADKSDIPTTLPANGGNADTVDGKHADDFLQ